MTDAAASAAAPGASAAPDTGATATAAAGGESAASGAPGDSAATTVLLSVNVNEDAGASGTSGPPAPTVKDVKVATVPPVVVSRCLYHVQMMPLYFFTFQHLKIIYCHQRKIKLK